MEHELSAFYDITHGLGLAQRTPRFLRYWLNDQTVSRFVRFGVEVFGIDKTLKPYGNRRTQYPKLRNILL